eukprot:TRINITY_DN3718_c1_g1_i5.p1 TRINITY_DN3718_c1_g1~~TRINITY_DN3718_c1_g1_i5.p1  ORF type:complete len:503 (-),score=108.65 TRINITY_DN3718_c1_g1_i5:32-1429(-)
MACDSCNPQGEVPFRCATGFEDRMCSRCASGYFRTGSSCELCSPRGAILLAAIIIMTVVVFVYFGLGFARRLAVINVHDEDDQKEEAPSSDPDSPVPQLRSEAIIGLTINYYQTLSILCRRLPSVSIGLLIQVSDLSNVFGSSIGMECVYASLQGFVSQYIVAISLPLVVLALTGLVMAGTKVVLVLAKNKAPWWKAMCGRALMYLLNFLYFPLVAISISVFNCVPDPFTGYVQAVYLASHPYLECQAIPLALRVVVLVLYPVGLFVVFAGLLISYQRSSSSSYRSSIRAYFGFFFLHYKPHWSSIALVVLARRVAFALLNSLVDERSIWLYTLNMIILILSVLMCLYLYPYRIHTDMFVDVLSSVVLMLSYSLVYGEAAAHTVALMGAQEPWDVGGAATFVLFVVIQIIWGAALVLALLASKSPRALVGSRAYRGVLAILGVRRRPQNPRSIGMHEPPTGDEEP